MTLFIRRTRTTLALAAIYLCLAAGSGLRAQDPPASAPELAAVMGQVEALGAKGQWDEAMRVLQAEVSRYPTSLALRLALGNTAVRGGRYGRALAVFQEVLDKMDPASKAAGDVHLRMGETYRRSGDLESAVLSLRQAAQLLPDNSVVESTLALVLDVSGRHEEAVRHYREVLRIDPKNGMALNNLAFRLAESGGDLQEALALAQRAREAVPNLIEVEDTLGWIYLKQNQSDKAISAFSGLVEKQPENAEFHYHLGMALVQKGDPAGAARELETALKKHPSKEVAEKGMTALPS